MSEVATVTEVTAGRFRDTWVERHLQGRGDCQWVREGAGNGLIH